MRVCLLTLQAYEIQESYIYLTLCSCPGYTGLTHYLLIGHHQHHLMEMNLVSYSYLDKTDPTHLGRPTCPESRGSPHISCSMVLVKAFHLFIGIAAKNTFYVCWGFYAALKLIHQANSSPWNPSWIWGEGHQTHRRAHIILSFPMECNFIHCQAREGAKWDQRAPNTADLYRLHSLPFPAMQCG